MQLLRDRLVTKLWQMQNLVMAIFVSAELKLTYLVTFFGVWLKFTNWLIISITCTWWVSLLVDMRYRKHYDMQPTCAFTFGWFIAFESIDTSCFKRTELQLLVLFIQIVRIPRQLSQAPANVNFPRNARALSFKPIWNVTAAFIGWKSLREKSMR